MHAVQNQADLGISYSLFLLMPGAGTGSLPPGSAQSGAGLPTTSRGMTESVSSVAVAPAKVTWLTPALRSMGRVSRTTVKPWL